MALTLDTMPLIVTLLVTAVAAFTDTRHGIIPNWLTFPTLAAAPLVHLVIGGPGALGHSLLSAIVCGLVPLFLFAKGAMGGGDVKLFAAIGAMLPLELALGLQLQAYLCVAFLAMAVLALRGHLLAVLVSTYRIATPWKRREARPIASEAALHTVRMGLGIFFAALLALVPELLP